MRRLWTSVTLYTLYVLAIWSVIGWVTINNTNNVALVWFIATVTTMGSVASGLFIFGKR